MELELYGKGCFLVLEEKGSINLKMIGIDYSRATIEQRGAFAVPHSGYFAICDRLKEKFPLEGIVIISTCNRTEFWFSCSSDDNICSAVDMFCYAMNVEKETCKELLVTRNGIEAVGYLFELVCGIHSQIFGEDQILTQVKGAIDRARSSKTCDTVLEILFRTAITAGKKVKTTTRLVEDNSSVAKRAIDLIEEKFIEEKNCSFDGKNCLVIGNGQTGRLATQILIEKKCNVFMTLRQYKKHDAIIPRGCKVVDYEDRFNIIPKMDIIVSATLSPNLTVEYDDVADKLIPDIEYTFLDLAVPHDIDTNIAKIENAKLYDVDSFTQTNEHSDTVELVMANKILDEYIDDFVKWYFFREHIPSVQMIGKLAGDNARGRLKKTVKNLDITGEQKQVLAYEIGQATQKIVSSLMYGLREHLDKDEWLQCMSALENSAKDMK